MKKNIFSLSAIAVTFAVMAGCGGKEVAQQPVEPAKPSFVEHCQYFGSLDAPVPAPEWFCSPNIEGGIAATGEAKPNAARDGNLQRNIAMLNGRNSLASILEADLESLLTDWAATTGAGDGETYGKRTEVIVRQVSQQTLKGSRQLRRWTAPDGTLVLLVGITDLDAIKDGLKTALRNDEAYWQMRGSDQALENLDKQVEAKYSKGNK